MTKYQAKIDDIKNSDGDLLVVDGSTLKYCDKITFACTTWRERRKKRSFILVSSESVVLSMETEDECKISTHRVPYWSFEQYEAACEKDDSFFQSVKNNLWCGDGEIDNKVDKSALLRSKYHFAGGSVRWMFHYDLKTVKYAKSIQKMLILNEKYW